MTTVSDDRSDRPPAAKPGDALLRTEDLRKTYPTSGGALEVLAGVNLELGRGELVALIGPSGCGKSTLLHLLAALDTPTSGTVYFDGDALNAFSSAQRADFRNRRTGFVWQRHHLLADFTAEENVAFPLLLRGAPMSVALRTAREGLERVGLQERAGHLAAELSGGERQRVAIARALSGQPALLFADEPTGDLDEDTAEGVFRLLRRLHAERRFTSLLATHNMALASRCDRVLRLEHGVISQVPVSPGESEVRRAQEENRVTHV